MPARYTAYATRNVDYLIRTTDPQGPQWREDTAAWREELIHYCRLTEFRSLEILSDEFDPERGRAYVTFRVDLRQGDDPLGFTERSLFVCRDQRWLYHSAVDNDQGADAPLSHRPAKTDPLKPPR